MKIAHSNTGKAIAENVRQVQEKKQQLINRIRPHKGHKLFEYNIETNEIKEAEIEAVVKYEGSSKQKVQKKVVAQKNCLYVSALNEKNAIKKLKKRFTK